MDYATSYAAIVKYDKNDDGTLMVFGKATDDTLDLDSQICDPKWLDEAMPQWFKSGGNIREMHGPSAAGVAKEYEAKSDGHYIGVHVVDPLAAKKVETGVYQGFSVGIKAPRVIRDAKAVNGRIVGGQIIEVSLVDRPANPSAKLILAKAVEGESSLVQVEEVIEKYNENHDEQGRFSEGSGGGNSGSGERSFHSIDPKTGPSNAQRIEFAREMHGEGSKQHLEAQERWGNSQNANAESTKNDYEGFHDAPTRENDAPLHDLTANGIYPDDVYSDKGEHIYGTGHRGGLDAKAHELIREMQGKPNAKVEVYRAIPSDAKGGINRGDWVTPFKEYAEAHGEGALNGDYKIVSLEVKASDIFTEGNSWLEWGYDPKSEKALTTDKGTKMETIKQITELAKSLNADSVKFDKAKYEEAMAALADLISIEAGEIKEGHDETFSISHLLEAIGHLKAWYEGEEAEGEVVEEIVEEKAANDDEQREIAVGEKCDKCNKAMADCKCSDKDADADEDDVEKSADADAVEAIEEVAEATEVVAEEVSATEEVADETPSIEDVVEKAVKSAMESVKAEIATLQADKEAAVEKSIKLESELATALTKAVAGGPKRTSSATVAKTNEYLVKALTYKAKAEATTDPVLAKGYRALHDEFAAKANPVSENE